MMISRIMKKMIEYSNGKYQEAEGMILTREFLKAVELPEHYMNRIVYLVGHHHTLSEINGLDYQILIEADYLVNADESCYNKDNILQMKEKYFRTKTGIKILESIFGV